MTANILLEVHHDGVKHINQMGLEAAAQYPEDVVMMSGDVVGAFRDVPFNCWFREYFSGFIPELDLIVVNLCLPFGWTGSPVTIPSRDKQFKRSTIADRVSEPGVLQRSYFDWRQPPVRDAGVRHRPSEGHGDSAGHDRVQRKEVYDMAAAVPGTRAHLRFRFADGVHASVEDCQDRGVFVGSLRRYQGHLEAATRDDGFVALPRYVYPGSETVLQSATGAHVCPREDLGLAAGTAEPSRRHPMALSLV
jgi:hypothetical protein